MTHFAVSQNRPPSDRRLRAALHGLKAGAPIVIMLHGLKYDPRLPAHDPNRHIFSLRPDPSCKRAASWPRRLGLRGPAGLAIGFGWHAHGTIWQANANALPAGAQLGALLRRLRHLAPEHPIHLISHSLGARVALHAMKTAGPGVVNRMILITAAVFETELDDALKHPSAAQVEVFNIRSRANTLFDLLLRAAYPHRGCTAGRGRLRHANLVDLDIDAAATQAALTTAGFTIGKAPAHICHWSGYLREDICALYRSLLHRPERTPLPYLQTITQSQRQAVSFRARLSF
ncbi:MAG: hypothetical protein AAFU41_07990 [Pseudomonadota bacterium]